MNEYNPFVVDEGMDLIDLVQAIAYDRSIEESTVSLREGAEYLDISEEALYNLVESKKILGLRVPDGSYRFTLSALDHYAGFEMFAAQLRHTDEINTRLATAVLGLRSRPYVVWLIREGYLKGRKLPNNQWVVRVDSLEKYLQTHSRDRRHFPLDEGKHLYLVFLDDEKAEELEEQGVPLVRRFLEDVIEY